MARPACIRTELAQTLAGNRGASMSISRQVQILFGLVLSLGIATILTIFGAVPKAALGVRLESEAVWWAAAIVLIAYVRLGEKLPFASIGIRPLRSRDAIAAAVGAFGVASATVIAYLALFPVLILSISLSHVPNTLTMPLWYRALLTIRIAVAGEFLFRAYPIERLTELRLNRWLASAISLAIYIFANWLGWNPVESIATALGGLVLTLLYLWRRSLWVNAIAQGIAVGFGLLLH